jgi:hypothetical protein
MWRRRSGVEGYDNGPSSESHSNAIIHRARRTSMNEDSEIRDRLTALEGRVSVGLPPALPEAPAPAGGLLARQRHHFRFSFAAAAALTLVVAATAVAGVAIVSGNAHGYQGIENPGQPLAGAQMECMTPPQAAALLAAHGFTDVVWQIESGTSKQGTSTVSATAPEHGYVVPGAILDDGKVHMVVDQRSGAAPAGICPAMAMP